MNEPTASKVIFSIKKLYKRWLLHASLVTAALIPGYRTIAQSTEQAWTYYKAQDYDRAILEFNKVVTQFPDLADAYDGLGWSYYWRGEIEEAEQSFQKALRLNAEDKSALEGIVEIKKWRYSEFSAAWNLFYQGLYEEAVTKFLSVLNDAGKRLPYEEHWKISSGLGWSYYYLRNYSAAQEHFKSLLGMDAKNAYGLKGMGYVLYQLGNYDESLTYLQQALDKEPTWQDATAMMGWCRYNQNQYEPALKYFDQALKANPFLADAAYGKAWTLTRLSKQHDAMLAFKAAVRLNPMHPSVGEVFKIIDATKDWWSLYEDFGWSYYTAKMWTEAESTFRYALKKLPENASLYLGLGYANFRLSNYQQAIDALTYYLNLVKEPSVITEPFVTGDGKGENALSDANSIIGWCYYYLKLTEKAILHFTAAINSHPAWSDPWSGLGWCYLAKSDLLKAEENFQKALELNPKLIDANNGLQEARRLRYVDFNAAWEAYYAGRYEPAIAGFTKAKESESLLDQEDRWKIYTGLGWSRLMSGNYQAAFPEFEHVLTISPNNPYALQGLARAACDSGDYERGMEYLNNIKEEGRDNLDTELLKAYCLSKDDRNLEAETLYLQIAEQWPDSSYAYSGLGWVYFRQNKLVQAKEAFLKALKLAPNLVEALDGMTAIRKKEGEGK